MKRTIVGLAGITIALLMALVVSAGAQTPTPFKRTVLQQADLSAPGREVVQALAEVQPGAASGRHTHPGEEIAYVLAGPLVLEIEGKPAKTLQTGEVFMIPAGTVHNAKNTGSGVAKVLATYVIEKGKPRERGKSHLYRQQGPRDSEERARHRASCVGDRTRPRVVRRSGAAR